jgi:hypothetical protein
VNEKMGTKVLGLLDVMFIDFGSIRGEIGELRVHMQALRSSRRRRRPRHRNLTIPAAQRPRRA